MIGALPAPCIIGGGLWCSSVATMLWDVGHSRVSEDATRFWAAYIGMCLGIAVFGIGLV